MKFELKNLPRNSTDEEIIAEIKHCLTRQDLVVNKIDKIPTNTVPKQVERIKDSILNPSEVIFKTQTGKSAIELIREGKL